MITCRNCGQRAAAPTEQPLGVAERKENALLTGLIRARLERLRTA